MLQVINEVKLKSLGKANLFACADDISTSVDLRAIIEMSAEDTRNAIMDMYPDFDFSKINMRG